MANQIVTEIVLDLDKLKGQLKDAEGEGAKSGKKIGDGFGGGFEGAASKALGGIKGQLLALAGAVAGAFTLKAVVAEAMDAEDATNSFAASLRAAGKLSAESLGDFQAYASALQKITTAGDDAIVKNAALLVSVGKLSGDGLKTATQASLDLAAGLNMDLSAAFELVSKAASGNVTALSRFGVRVRKTGDEARDFQTALQKINDTFGGMAESKVNTFGGAVAQLKNAFSDTLESIGNFIVKSPVVVALIRHLGKSFSELAESLANFGQQGDFFGAIIKQALAFGQVIVTYVVKPIEFAVHAVETLATFLTAVFAFLLSTLVDTGAAIGKYLIEPVRELITGPLAALVGFFDQDAGAAFKKFSDDGSKAIADLTAKTQRDLGFLQQATVSATADAANRVFDFDVASTSAAYIAKLQEVAANAAPFAAQIAENMNSAMQPPFQAGWDFIVNGFNSAFSKVSLTSEKFRNELQVRLNSAFASFRDGVANSFQVIGAALVKGENVFSAFGKAILGLFGDLAIQLGSFYFLLGIGNLFLNPAAAAGQIAAGIGLTVLGGALKALAGGAGGGASTPSAAAGGGVAAGDAGGLGATANSTATQASEVEREKPVTSVTVQVQGNILDRRETGLALAEVINETFGSNGVVFAGSNA